MNVIPLKAYQALDRREPVTRRGALEAAAEQFEALFLQQMLKQMRKAGDVLSADSSVRSRDLDTLRDFHDQLLAERLAERRQGGIADLLVKQLSAAAPSALLADARGQAPAPSGGGGFAIPLQRSWERAGAAVDGFLHKGGQMFQQLVDKVIAQESSGRVDAVSPKGARGLMQLMPDTAREMAERLGLVYDEARLTRDATYNKQLGSAYLQQMLERYEGHQGLALAAYNAGPARVDEWLQRNGDPRRAEVDSAEWIDRIPFEETRQYTRRILDAMNASAARQESTLKPPAAMVALDTDKVASYHRSHSPAFAQLVRLGSQEQ